MQYGPPELPPHPELPPPEPTEPAADGLAWGGVGIGCGGYILLLLLMVPVFSIPLLADAGITAYVVYFCVPIVIGIGFLFVPKLRRMGTSILIVAAVFAAVAWIIALGPCLALLNIQESVS
jgi:hypothetical protein